MPPPKTVYLPMAMLGPSSVLSTFTPSAMAFIDTMRHRDRFLGKPACVVCGEDDEFGLGVTAIIPWTKEGTRVWKKLRSSGVIPDHVEHHHNPMNALVLCATHSAMLGAYSFYIDADPKTGKYIFVNLLDNPPQVRFHGKAIGLGIGDEAAPYPALFQFHEMQARKHHRSISVPSIPREIVWQDWLLKGAVDCDSGLFIRDHSASHDIPLPRSSKMDAHTPEPATGVSTSSGSGIMPSSNSRRLHSDGEDREVGATSTLSDRAPRKKRREGN